MAKKKKQAPPVKELPLLKLDLGCGDNIHKGPNGEDLGFVGVDKYKTSSTTYLVDLFKFPWTDSNGHTFKDSIVDELFAGNFIEHIPARTRPRFFEEAWRVLKVGSLFTIVCPYWSSFRAYGDFTHEWPPICEFSFLYWNKNWREQNKLTHGEYDIKCDFDFTYGYNLDGEFIPKHEEQRNYAVKHLVNSATDIQVTLIKRPM